jgi:hypothetical protein
MLHTWVAVPNDGNAGRVSPVRALVENGVTWWSHFALLTTNQVRTLSHVTPHSQNPVQVPLAQMNPVMVTLALHHHGSRELGKPLDPLSVNQTEFHTFREEVHDTQTPITHWGTTTPNVHDNGLAPWKQTMKPRARDFAPFWNKAH